MMVKVTGGQKGYFVPRTIFGDLMRPLTDHVQKKKTLKDGNAPIRQEEAIFDKESFSRNSQ